MAEEIPDIDIQDVELDIDNSNASTSANKSAGDIITDDTDQTHPAILDGTFFRVISVSYDGKIKAVCTACPDGKKPLSGAIGSTTNFLLHLKVYRL